ncbi:hypothetical protein PIB30_077167 [Stylosanthes scabra]|uniref:Uncharacterized protein n=1 Tax=Stylosanthes scabra TaxID=79078 RepID=A0ABU6XQL5_9FABA|nr:hypothetical protein [Stylosanthes scabra]
MDSCAITSAQPWPLGFAPPLLVFSEVVRVNESTAEFAGTHHRFSSKLRNLIESVMLCRCVGTVVDQSILPLPKSIQNGTESKGPVLTSHESILALLESIPLHWNCVFRVDRIDSTTLRIDSYPSRDEISLSGPQGINSHPSGIDSGPKYFNNW